MTAGTLPGIPAITGVKQVPKMVKEFTTALRIAATQRPLTPDEQKEFDSLLKKVGTLSTREFFVVMVASRAILPSVLDGLKAPPGGSLRPRSHQ